MRFNVAAAIVVTAWSAGLLQQGARAEQPAAGTSTWTGVYTEAQAKAGEEQYVKHCSDCHGYDLGGDGFAPSLKGPEFVSNWNGLTVGDLFERIRISMPPSHANEVSPKDKSLIVAYLLQQSGFPAGKSELAATTDALKSIKFEANKPGR